jgi:hypothetical protein
VGLLREEGNLCCKLWERVRLTNRYAKELINRGKRVIVLYGVLGLYLRKGLLPDIGPRTLADDILVDRSLALNTYKKGRSIRFLLSLLLRPLLFLYRR